LLSALDLNLPVAGKSVAVQEYGVRNEELLAELLRRGARLIAVPVYGWALPENTGLSFAKTPKLRPAGEWLICRR
jgi:uroporphyrinogen-III synthase